jgi:hypothetical protein
MERLGLEVSVGKCCVWRLLGSHWSLPRTRYREEHLASDVGLRLAPLFLRWKCGWDMIPVE